MFKNVIICAIVGAASAIKQGVDTQTEGNMGETLTATTYAVENFDDITASIENFYSDEMKPKIKEQRNAVFEAAIAESELKWGKLLETCDEGTACRETIMEEIKAEIKQIWLDKISEIKRSITTAIQDTKEEVDITWDKLVQCQIDKPCCSYNEVTWRNNVIEIVTKREELSDYVKKWQEFEVRRIAIELECPTKDWPECPSDEISTCWDGSDRETDCSCTASPYAACPAAPCENGSARDPETCMCDTIFSIMPVIEPVPQLIEPVEISTADPAQAEEVVADIEAAVVPAVIDASD